MRCVAPRVAHDTAAHPLANLLRRLHALFRAHARRQLDENTAHHQQNGAQRRHQQLASARHRQLAGDQPAQHERTDDPVDMPRHFRDGRRQLAIHGGVPLQPGHADEGHAKGLCVKHGRRRRHFNGRIQR